MRVYIMTDLEGVAGVLDSENWCLNESRYYEQAKELLTGEVNAAVEGFVAAGATEALVVDGHGYGAVNPSLLHPKAQLARNWPGGKAYPFNLEEGFVGAAWIGQHPKAGAVGGHLCHTGSMDLRDVTINGLSVGEFGEIALCAAELRIPAIFASGCEAFCREAQALTPGIETAAVKRGTQSDPGHYLPATAYRRHNTGAVHCSPVEARARIRAGAQRALERIRREKFGLLTMKPPYEMIAVFRSTDTLPPRIARKRHDRSVIELLNAPWDVQPIRTFDPLSLLTAGKP